MVSPTAGETGAHQPGRGSSRSGSASNFRFTFNCSTAGSGSSKDSFIEPDPNAETMMMDDSSQSLSDSVQDFPEEFGRTYHAYRAGSYAYPNDMIEQERLGLQSEVLTSLFGGKLYFAPLDHANPPRTILDVATGTGDWAIQIGDAFPTAEVIATDLSPIQPFDVPPNVSFFVEDSGEPWDYSHNFDYIHTRVTTGCWASFKTQVAEQAFEYLAPGAWFESQEFDCVLCCDDGTLRPDGALARWFEEMQVAGDAVDRPLVMARGVKAAYKEAGFVDIQERVFKMPTNGWPKDEKLKELGRTWERQFQQGLSGFSFWLFNRAFGRTPQQTEVSLVDVRREFSDTRIHAYIPIHVVWGRKPFPGEVAPP